MHTDRRRLTLAATILGSSLAFIDATVVNIALPVMERDLDLGLTGVQWVYLAYSLALAALYLTAGAVGDRWGRRRVFTAGAIGFALASALAGAAPNEVMIVTARALQGIAGAFLTTNSLALLRSVYGAQSGRAVGLWTSFTSVATVIGPPAGGALVEWTSWRWIFFINLPLAAATVVLARLGRGPEQEQVQVGRLDFGGAALAALGFGALTYAMVEGADHGFGGVWWAFAVAGLALVAFVLVEQRVREPLLPFSLFRIRNFAAANVETFLVYAALGGVFLYFTIYLQFLGFSPFEAGLANLPPSLILILFAARFGELAGRYGPRAFLTLGPALFGAGCLLLLVVDSRSDFWTAGIGGLALISLGLAVFVAPITATAISSAPERYAGIASGVNTTLSRLGGLLAVAVIGLAVTLVFEARAGHRGVPLAVGQKAPELRDASVAGFRAGMLIAAGLAFVGAAVGWVGISNAEAMEPVSREEPALAEP